MGVFMAFVLAVANIAYLFYQKGGSVGVLSGNSIRETVTRLYTGSSIGHRIFVISQFLLLFVIIVIILIVVWKLKSKAGISKQNYIGKGNVKSKTDLDTLYVILKHEKEISIKDIGKVFKINSEISLEWSKVLENGDLAIIDYPRFGKPVLRLVEKESVEKSGLIGEIKNKKGDEMKAVDGKTQVFEKTIKDVVETEKREVPKNISKRVKRKIDKKIKKIDKKIEKLSKKIKKRRKKKLKRSR